MDKVIREGKVAVLVSPGYGAGWYTWNQGHEECLYDPDVVAWVENGKVGECPDLGTKYGWKYFCDGGAHQLVIEWLPLNTLFLVREYDGKEWIETADSMEWLEA